LHFSPGVNPLACCAPRLWPPPEICQTTNPLGKNPLPINPGDSERDMMPTTDQLIKLLSDSHLLPDDALAELRTRLAKAPGRVDPRSVTKWLVQRRLVTVDQALDFLDGRIPTIAKAEPGQSHHVAGEELLLADDLEVITDKLEVIDDDLEVVDDQLEVVDEDLQAVDADLEVVDDELEVIEERPRSAPPARAAKSPPGPPRQTAAPTRQSAAPPRPPVKQPAVLPPAPATDLLQGMPTPPAGISSAPLGGPLLGAPMTARLGKKKKLGKSNVWDSPLLLFGGGSLLGLIILGGVLYWAIGRQTGDEALRLAEADYQAGSYTQAVHKFDQYLKNYPTHTGVGTARVHRGLAYMRQTIDNSSDWTRSLAASQETLDQIAREKEFPQARSELAALLPRVAEGLAEQARRKPSAKLVEQTSAALALVEKYVPRSLRPAEQLQAVEQSLALSRLQLARDDSLHKALQKIEEATAASRPGDAYGIRKELLKTYPDLEQDASLQKALLAISQSEKDDVKMVSQPQSAMAAAADQAATAVVSLVNHTSGNVGGAEGIVLAEADGAVYALDAATGHTAWRRFVGFDAPHVTRLIQRQATPHALLVDSVRHELVCAAAADGKPVWRQSLGESPTAHLLVLRNRVAAAMDDGRLLLVDLEAGDSPGFVQFPHRLSVAPATDARERNFYQLADHSNLYVVSAKDGDCKEVVYLGHEADSIRVAPLVVGKYLLIAENQGAASSLLRVFTMDDEGLNVRLVQNVPLEGHVHVPPQVTQSKTLLVITDRGTFYTFDIGSAEKKDPLTQVASRPSMDDRPLVRFALARGAEFFVADNQLSKFDIQAAQGRLSPQWEQNRGDVFLQPLEVAGECLIHVRRKADLPGVAVAAANMSDGSIVWETQLAAPLAGDPQVIDAEQTIVAANLAGGVFRLAAGELETSIVESQSNENASPTRPTKAARSASTKAGVAAFRVDDKQLVSVAPGGQQLQWRSLTTPGALSMGPVSMGDSLLVGTRSGQVLLLDAESGRPAAEPFQPKLESGLEIEWRTPSVTEAGDIVVADNYQRLFRLRSEPQPRPHLALKHEKDLPENVSTRLAISGELVYAGMPGGQLMALALEDLEIAAEWNLSAPVIWGPYAVENKVLAATADGTLVCLDGKQELWRAPLAHGALNGAPLAMEGRWVLAAKSGMLYSILPADGSQQQQVDVGQPLASGPIVLGKSLLVAGHDGVLLQVPAP
jgi:outer membrane protein assembly factor BamB